MSYVQLIEKIDMPTQVWLTFWDLEDNVQISVEIIAPKTVYEVGALFFLSRDSRAEDIALRQVDRTELPSSAEMLIPLPASSVRLGGTGRVRSARFVVQNPPDADRRLPNITGYVGD